MQYRTLLSIATPISVKANAPYLLPPQLEVTFWHLKIYLRQSRGRGFGVCRKVHKKGKEIRKYFFFFFFYGNMLAF